MTYALYLTGVPSVGKSTVARGLEARTGALRLSYGEILTEMLRGTVVDQADLRTQSAQVISAQTVRNADELVAEAMRHARGDRNVVVDSHAVTAEAYGLRVVPYTPDEVVGLPFTHVVCLIAPDDVIRRRVDERADGRRVQDVHDVALHASLQSNLALSYSTTLGIPAAFIRTDRPDYEVLDAVEAFVSERS